MIYRRESVDVLTGWQIGSGMNKARANCKVKTGKESERIEIRKWERNQSHTKCIIVPPVITASLSSGHVLRVVFCHYYYLPVLFFVVI